MALPDFLSFTPVPLKKRHDGWSPALQAEFVELLARGRSVAGAAHSLGKSRASAYALRERPDAAGFAGAWDAALAYAKGMRMAAAARPKPPPVRRQPGSRGIPPGSPQHRAFEHLLAMLYPSMAGPAGETDKTDRPGRA